MDQIDDFLKAVADYHNCDYYSALDEMILSNEMKELIDVLSKIFTDNSYSLIPRIDNIEKTVDNIHKGQDYLKENFDIHQVSTISYSDKDKLIKKLRAIKNKDFMDVRRLLAYAKYSKLKSPFDLKILINNSTDIEGVTGLRYINTDGKFCRSFEPFFDDIYVNSIGSNTADLTYVHEITHTQTESVCTSYKSILHMETLSNLLEMIYVSDCCSDKKIMGVNLGNVGEFVNCSEFIKDNELIDKIYFYARYFAMELFSIYVSLNQHDKQKMKDLIQNIFDGKMSVDDLCSEYNVEFNKPHKDIIIRSLSK